MNHKPPDRRSERTRRLISEAFVALLREKLYSQITVQDIIDRADIGRSTFYAHYQDKADLLASGFARVLDHLQHAAQAHRAGDPDVLPVTGLFAHMQQVGFIVEAVAIDERADLLFRQMHAALAGVFEKHLAARLQGQPRPLVPTAAAANYLAGAYLALARWWFEARQPYPPERMDEIFQALALPTIHSFQRER